MRSFASTRRTRFRRPGTTILPILAVATVVLLGPITARQARALVRFDFEQMYFEHPGRQVWDFSIVRADSTYHIFYHAIPQATPHAANADTIWHGSSPDLRHWQILEPVLATTAGTWQAGALWAPDVVRDKPGDRWVMAYTGCDDQFNQRIGFAFSDDLLHWTASASNPTVEPDTNLYLWNPSSQWSDFRDPFLYRDGGMWHVLVTAKQDLGGSTGVLYHGVSADLDRWQDVGPLFVNDGFDPWRVPESSQYHVIGQTHHLLFGEFDTIGVTLLSASSPAGWTMDDLRILDYGYAPELDEFDPGVRIFSRLAPFYLPNGGDLAYVVRLDTLLADPDGSNLQVYKPHPLDQDWAVHTGTCNLGNPIYGDNPLWRGEPSVGLVGHGYYGSREYYQGPLSGRGSPGTMLGDAVTGELESRPFTVTGNRMRLLVGGGNYPTTCYVALVDADDDAVIYSETGDGSDPMTPRIWDLTPHLGRSCKIVIVDQETGPFGHINVDEIVEEMDELAGVGTPPAGAGAVSSLRAFPNPANPATEIHFELARPAQVSVAIHDLRGRRIWSSGRRDGRSGTNSVLWRGLDQAGEPVPAGTYLVRVRTGNRDAATAKISIVK